MVDIRNERLYNYSNDSQYVERMKKEGFNLKIKCILKDTNWGLTYNKIYTITPKWGYKYLDKYFLKNDKGEEKLYYKAWFEKI